MGNFRERAETIAADRERGASVLLAELLPVLDDAVAAGREATVDVAQRICAGQPAMAPLWNICAAAMADFAIPGRYARRRAEVLRAPRALVRAATLALRDALRDRQTPLVLTWSHSGSVAATLLELGKRMPFQVVCAESLPGGEGVALSDTLRGAGLSVEVVADATMTTYLPEASAVVVGADAVGARHWTNKAGTYGLSAAAWFSGVPVYVVASRDKAVAAALDVAMSPSRLFEHVPAQLATLYLTDVGSIPPEGLDVFAERFQPDLRYLLEIL